MSQGFVRRILDHAKSGGWFFLAGLVAGLLNYGFQVVASRELSSADFASLNGWFANLAIFFFLGGVLQYGSLFFPSRGRALRIQLVAVNAISLLFVWAWFAQPETLGLARASMILVSSATFGWVMGQVQFRLAFTLLAVASFVQAVAKVGVVLLPWFSENRLEAYALSFFVAYLPAQWISTVYLWRSETSAVPEKIGGWRPWIAPFLLSCAVAIMPQYDLVLMSHTQLPRDFESFARASLFYKGVYFVLFIVAQWLLPQQVRGKTEVRGLGLATLFAVIFSVLLTVAAPLISSLILKWDSSPEWWLILGSCLHMSLLTLAFLGIQQTCADGRVGVAAFAIALLLAKGGIQMLFALALPTYLAYAIVAQIPITYLLWRGRKRA